MAIDHSNLLKPWSLVILYSYILNNIHLTGILYLVTGCILPIFNVNITDNIICIFHSLEVTAAIVNETFSSDSLLISNLN